VSTQVQVAAALWPPDDTEESILGVDRHQLDITSLRGGVNEDAYRLAHVGGGPPPWQAISQIMLLGCARPDATPYTAYPDVNVFPPHVPHPQPLQPGRRRCWWWAARTPQRPAWTWRGVKHGATGRSGWPSTWCWTPPAYWCPASGAAGGWRAMRTAPGSRRSARRARRAGAAAR